MSHSHSHSHSQSPQPLSLSASPPVEEGGASGAARAGHGVRFSFPRRGTLHPDCIMSRKWQLCAEGPGEMSEPELMIECNGLEFAVVTPPNVIRSRVLYRDGSIDATEIRKAIFQPHGLLRIRFRLRGKIAVDAARDPVAFSAASRQFFLFTNTGQVTAFRRKYESRKADADDDDGADVPPSPFAVPFSQLKDSSRSPASLRHSRSSSNDTANGTNDETYDALALMVALDTAPDAFVLWEGGAAVGHAIPTTVAELESELSLRFAAPRDLELVSVTVLDPVFDQWHPLTSLKQLVSAAAPSHLRAKLRLTTNAKVGFLSSAEIDSLMQMPTVSPTAPPAPAAPLPPAVNDYVQLVLGNAAFDIHNMPAPPLAAPPRKTDDLASLLSPAVFAPLHAGAAPSSPRPGDVQLELSELLPWEAEYDGVSRHLVGWSSGRKAFSVTAVSVPPPSAPALRPLTCSLAVGTVTLDVSTELVVSGGAYRVVTILDEDVVLSQLVGRMLEPEVQGDDPYAPRTVLAQLPVSLVADCVASTIRPLVVYAARGERDGNSTSRKRKVRADDDDGSAWAPPASRAKPLSSASASPSHSPVWLGSESPLLSGAAASLLSALARPPAALAAALATVELTPSLGGELVLHALRLARVGAVRALLFGAGDAPPLLAPLLATRPWAEWVEPVTGNTVVHLAVLLGSPFVLGSLLKTYGADLGAVLTMGNARRRTPLGLAVALGRARLVPLLIHWGASLTDADVGAATVSGAAAAPVLAHYAVVAGAAAGTAACTHRNITAFLGLWAASSVSSSVSSSESGASSPGLAFDGASGAEEEEADTTEGTAKPQAWAAEAQHKVDAVPMMELRRPPSMMPDDGVLRLGVVAAGRDEPPPAPSSPKRKKKKVRSAADGSATEAGSAGVEQSAGDGDAATVRRRWWTAGLVGTVLFGVALAVFVALVAFYATDGQVCAGTPPSPVELSAMVKYGGLSVSEIRNRGYFNCSVLTLEGWPLDDEHVLRNVSAIGRSMCRGIGAAIFYNGLDLERSIDARIQMTEYVDVADVIIGWDRSLPRTARSSRVVSRPIVHETLAVVTHTNATLGVWLGHALGWTRPESAEPDAEVRAAVSAAVVARAGGGGGRGWTYLANATVCVTADAMRVMAAENHALLSTVATVVSVGDVFDGFAKLDGGALALDRVTFVESESKCAALIGRLSAVAGHITHVAHSIAADPKQPISSLGQVAADVAASWTIDPQAVSLVASMVAAVPRRHAADAVLATVVSGVVNVAQLADAAGVGREDAFSRTFDNALVQRLLVDGEAAYGLTSMVARGFLRASLRWGGSVNEMLQLVFGAEGAGVVRAPFSVNAFWNEGGTMVVDHVDAPELKVSLFDLSAVALAADPMVAGSPPTRTPHRISPTVFAILAVLVCLLMIGALVVVVRAILSVRSVAPPAADSGEGADAPAAAAGGRAKHDDVHAAGVGVGGGGDGEWVWIPVADEGAGSSRRAPSGDDLWAMAEEEYGAVVGGRTSPASQVEVEASSGLDFSRTGDDDDGGWSDFSDTA